MWKMDPSRAPTAPPALPHTRGFMKRRFTPKIAGSVIPSAADQIIDMGPEGGQGGGTIICTGTPEKIAECKESYTGQYLKPLLEKGEDHGKSNCS